MFDKLNQFHADSGQAKTVVIERALGIYCILMIIMKDGKSSNIMNRERKNIWGYK